MYTKPKGIDSEVIWSAEDRRRRPKIRQSVIHLAHDVVGDRLHYEESGELYLWKNDTWKWGTRLWHVMKAANTILKRRREKQMLHNPCWEVA